MSLESFKDRNPENSHGKYYVDSACLDCDLCRDTAPTIFKRFDSKGYSYVAKQPETLEEFEQARVCLESCCCEAIFDDGDQFDWDFNYPLDSNKTERESSSCGSNYGLGKGALQLQSEVRF